MIVTFTSELDEFLFAGGYERISKEFAYVRAIYTGRRARQSDYAN